MNMRKYKMACVAIFAATFLGCGSSEPVVAPELAKAQPGLNGGTAFPIPEDLGYAEVVLERTRPGQPAVLAVYFLDTTARKAIGVQPESVRASLIIPVEDAPKEVTLSAKAKPGKSEGKRFAAEPGNYDFDELRGELFVTLSGKEVVVPFAFR